MVFKASPVCTKVANNENLYSPQMVETAENKKLN